MSTNPIRVEHAPAGANPLAKALGGKIRLVRVGRGLNHDQASFQLGITKGHLIWLELGRTTPGPEMCKRLYGWMKEGITYEGAPALSEAQIRADVPAENYRQIKTVIMKEEAKELKRRAGALGMSMSALVHTLIKQFLNSGGTYATLKEAIEAVNHSRMVATLQEEPELRDILQSELKLMIAAGATTTHYTKQEKGSSLPELATMDVDTPKLDVGEAVDIMEEVDDVET